MGYGLWASWTRASIVGRVGLMGSMLDASHGSWRGAYRFACLTVTLRLALPRYQPRVISGRARSGVGHLMRTVLCSHQGRRSGRRWGREQASSVNRGSVEQSPPFSPDHPGLGAWRAHRPDLIYMLPTLAFVLPWLGVTRCAHVASHRILSVMLEGKEAKGMRMCTER